MDIFESKNEARRFYVRGVELAEVKRGESIKKYTPFI